MSATFREQAEARIRELEQREHDRHVRAEQRAAEQRSAQAELRERREAKRQVEAERAAADQLAALARDHGAETAGRVRLAAEYNAFACDARGVLVATSRPPGSTSRDNWRHQQRLQEQLGVGLDAPRILTGGQLAEAAAGLALHVDPTTAELESRTS